MHIGVAGGLSISSTFQISGPTALLWCWHRPQVTEFGSVPFKLLTMIFTVILVIVYGKGQIRSSCLFEMLHGDHKTSGRFSLSAIIICSLSMASQPLTIAHLIYCIIWKQYYNYSAPSIHKNTDILTDLFN